MSSGATESQQDSVGLSTWESQNMASIIYLRCESPFEVTPVARGSLGVSGE